MADHFQIPLHVEQDNVGGDELPTYGDLTEQNGPNSRFGRWREWIEKRAAERYQDITPQELDRRRERGWGNSPEPEEIDIDLSPPPFISVEQPPTPPPKSLRVQTDVHVYSLDASYTNDNDDSPPLPPLPLVPQIIPPTHILLNQFGSRFLPHTTSPIRCLLPLLSHRLLLIGHENGLSVLNMFPQEQSEDGQTVLKGPDEAQAKPIWDGEGVYQMSILEEEKTGEGCPRGVVLALVGSEPSSPSTKESEPFRSLRMYNLASLISLAKWTVTQNGGRPLDLRHASNRAQSPTKKHRKHGSITRSIKSLIESPQSTTPHHGWSDSRPSHPNKLSPSSANTGHARIQPVRQDSWELIDDLPLRWATDFVPLASAGSRLVHTSVLFFDLWPEDGTLSRGGTTLAVAAKSNIFLYETPKGERAFRFVKEFYTPMQPRRMTFIQQTVQDINRTPSSSPSRSHRDRTFSSHSRSDSNIPLIRNSTDSHTAIKLNPDLPIKYGTQRSLFVVFDKKAGWIRIADSAVGEIELYDDNWGTHSLSHCRESSPALTSSMRLSRAPAENQQKGQWVPPVHVDLPISSHHPGEHSASCSVYLLTRGKLTHILPCPLPTNFASNPPIHVVSWASPPTALTPRVCYAAPWEGEDRQAFLQLIGFGEECVEVQEISLSFLNKGKGKARAEDSVRAQADLGGSTGLLRCGGRWDRLDTYGPGLLSRSASTASDQSVASTETLASQDINSTRRLQEGVYGWCQKGAHDWRVFWLGGSTRLGTV